MGTVITVRSTVDCGLMIIMRAIIVVIVGAVAGVRRGNVDPFLLPFPDRSSEHRGWSVPSGGPPESSPHSFHLTRSRWIGDDFAVTRSISLSLFRSLYLSLFFFPVVFFLLFKGMFSNQISYKNTQIVNFKKNPFLHFHLNLELSTLIFNIL